MATYCHLPVVCIANWLQLYSYRDVQALALLLLPTCNRGGGGCVGCVCLNLDSSTSHLKKFCKWGHRTEQMVGVVAKGVWD